MEIKHINIFEFLNGYNTQKREKFQFSRGTNEECDMCLITITLKSDK